MAHPPPSCEDPKRQADERTLIASAQAGDASAFRVLVERHQHRSYALALRITRSAADAEEVAQDTFVKVWDALPGFRGESSFATWLHRIVTRRAIDRAETLKRRRAREARQDAMGEPQAQVQYGDVLEAEQLQRLMEERLSKAQYLAVTLFYYEGRSVEQVGAMLGMNENTVKTHLSRARAVLRDAWLAVGGEGT
ncbi:MAG: RNA polymerase sigma factor [Candidatus Eisenbacteria bacterium]